MPYVSKCKKNYTVLKSKHINFFYFFFYNKPFGFCRYSSHGVAYLYFLRFGHVWGCDQCLCFPVHVTQAKGRVGQELTYRTELQGKGSSGRGTYPDTETGGGGGGAVLSAKHKHKYSLQSRHKHEHNTQARTDATEQNALDSDPRGTGTKTAGSIAAASEWVSVCVKWGATDARGRETSRREGTKKEGTGKGGGGGEQVSPSLPHYTTQRDQGVAMATEAHSCRRYQQHFT